MKDIFNVHRLNMKVQCAVTWSVWIHHIWFQGIFWSVCLHDQTHWEQTSSFWCIL